MTISNDCDSVLAELDAWLDGSMPQADRSRVELHLAGCEECRTIADDARLIVPLARALPLEVQPPRDLWPDLEGRLVGPEVRAKTPGSGWLPGRWAAAALVLVAIGSGALTALALHQLPVPTTVASSPSSPSATAAEAGTAFQTDVEQAATELASAVEVRRNELDPETLQVVDANLKIIDQAITEIRTALDRDPADGRAKDALVAAYNQKVRLLQAVLHTPSRG